jgi:poly(3-hydroxybutyrate) depolymerase
VHRIREPGNVLLRDAATVPDHLGRSPRRIRARPIRVSTDVTRVLGALVVALLVAPSAHAGVKTLTFSYRTHNGAMRPAYLVLPTWYGAKRHPTIPLVISPHGRGVNGKYNLRFWGAIAARGPFAVVAPDGQGRRLGPAYSWGYRGQIDDLARMPALATHAFPWLRVNRKRIYAIGDSMGAQEVLLLAARMHLAGVAAFDLVSDMAARYRAWAVTPGEMDLPAKARVEFGGTPASDPSLYAARSPITYARAIARSRIPVQLWWSTKDAVITDHDIQSTRFYDRLVALDARVARVVGDWAHGHAMHPETNLPAALACFGLIPRTGVNVPFPSGFCTRV